MDRQTKEAMVVSLNEIFTSAQAGFLVDFRGLTVEQANDLRRKLRDASSHMRVLKNNMAKLAIKGTPFEAMEPSIVDTRAIVYAEEPVAPAKVVTDFARSNQKFQIVTGVLVKGKAGELIDSATIQALATLPSRERLLAQSLSVMQAPAVNFVRTLSEVPGSFVRTLSAIGEAKGAASKTSGNSSRAC